MEFQHSASMASLPSIAGFSEPISEAEEIESVKRLQQEGDAAFRIKDFSLAAACYGEALEIDNDNAQLLARKTVSNIELGEYAEARKDAEYLIKLNPHVPQGHYLLAVSLNNLQAYTLAISAFLNALHYDIKHRDRLSDSIAVVAGNLCTFPEESLENFIDLSPAEKLLEVGISLKRVNQNTSCIEVLQNALDLKTLDELCQQRALFNIGAGYAGNNDNESAKDYFKQCLAIALKQKNQRYEAEVYCRLAEIYLWEENLEQGIVYYVKLLSICKDLETIENDNAKSCDLQRVVHETLSSAYKAVSDFPHALKHAKKNLEVLAGNNDKLGISSSDLLGKAHFTVASLHEVVRDFVSSLEHFMSYLAITKASKDCLGMGRAYGCIGRVYHKLSNYPLAQSFYEQQLHISGKLSYHTMEATALRSLADVHEDLGDTDKALGCLQRYLQMSRKLDEFETECWAFIAMGELHQAHGRPQHAQHFYEQALSLAERSHETELAFRSRCKLAQVLLISRDVKDLQKARKLAEDSVEYYIQALEDSKSNKEDVLQLLEQSYSLVQVALKKLERPYQALECAETQRRRVFLSTLAKNTSSSGQGTEAVEDMLSSSAAVEDMLKIANRESAAIVYLSLCHSCILIWVFKPGEGCWTGKDDQDMVGVDCSRYVQELVSLIRASESQASEAYETEFRALPLQDSKMHQLKTLNLAKDKQRTKKTGLPSEKEKSSSTAEESPSRKLYKLLLSQVESLLQGCSSVVIVADRVLSQVPFDALEDDEGRLFSDKYRLTLLPCMEALKYIHQHSGKDANQDQMEGNTISQSSPTHPIYLDHMLRVVVPPKERPHSIIRESNAEAPKMSQISDNPTYVSFDRNSYYVTKSPKDKVSVMEGRFLQDKEVSGSTLISKTWSGRDLASASRGKIQEYHQQGGRQRVLVVGNPTLPKRLRVHGKIWEPLSELHNAQEEAHKIAHYLDTEAIVGSKVTKETLLTELPKAMLVHLAMYGSWEQASLACTPNPTSEPLSDGSYSSSAYMIGVDDIVGLKLQAKMVVMSCCYGNRHRDIQLELPLAFLVAGVESLLLLLWAVPDIVRDKFWHYFYLALQEGRHVSQAIAEAKNSLRQDERFRSPRYWAAFCLLGGDPFITLIKVKHELLDQLLNTMESAYLNAQKQDVLNIRKDDMQDGSVESLLERLRTHLSGLLLHHTQHPDVIPLMAKLLSQCLHLIDPQNDNPMLPSSAQSLPQCIMTAPSAISLLNQLGFHFQAGGSSTQDPQMVFPQWDPDSIMEPALQALKGLQDISENGECAHNLARVLEGKEQLLSGLIDVISFTKHMPEVQLKVSDTGVSHLWGHHQARALLVSLGFAQVGKLLMFDGTISNKVLLHAALLVLCSTMGEKGRAMLHRLDIRYLGISSKSPIRRSARKTPIKSAMRSASTIRTLTPNVPRSCTPTAVRLRTAPVIFGEEPTRVKSLPSLNPVTVAKNKLAFSTPWWSQPSKSPEMKEKIRLARSLSDLHLEYARHAQHTRHWHVESVAPQAQKCLSAIGQHKPRPQVVKVKAGTTPSCSREPVDHEVEMSIEAIEQRRDYGHFLLHARSADVERRHSDAVRKLFQPYVSRRTADAVGK